MSLTILAIPDENVCENFIIVTKAVETSTEEESNNVIDFLRFDIVQGFEKIFSYNKLF